MKIENINKVNQIVEAVKVIDSKIAQISHIIEDADSDYKFSIIFQNETKISTADFWNLVDDVKISQKLDRFFYKTMENLTAVLEKEKNELLYELGKL